MMSTNRKKSARIVGALFLLAIVVSILGGGLIDTVLDAGNLGDLSASSTTVIAGVLLELINGVAVVGIAVFMFPIFRKTNEALALGYVAFRIIEAVIIVAAVVSPLTLIALSQEYTAAGAADAAYLQALGGSFIAVRTYLVGQLTGIFFSLAALLFYYLLFQSQLVPRFISVWGLIGVVLLLTWNLLEIFGISISWGMVLALPIILNEIFLGIWLIIKGFNSAAGVADPA